MLSVMLVYKGGYQTQTNCAHLGVIPGEPTPETNWEPIPRTNSVTKRSPSITDDIIATARAHSCKHTNGQSRHLPHA